MDNRKDNIWAPGEPNEQHEEYCLAIYTDGHGNDDKCMREKSYICEKEPDLHIDSNMNVEEGKTTSLKCPTSKTASDSQDIVWAKGIGDDAETLTHSTNHMVVTSIDLIFNSILWTDSGIYTCRYYAGIEPQSFCFNVTVNTRGTCHCECSYKEKLVYWANQAIPDRTNEEWVEYLKPILQKQRKELLVDKRNLTSAKRRRTSAPDSRVSSATMGYVAVFFICSTIGFIISTDVANFVKYVCN